MVKKIGIPLFWLAFFGFFLYKYIPNVWNYATGGFPPYAGNSWMSNRLWFALHISAGIFVWLVPLLFFEVYWRIKDSRSKQVMISPS